VVDGATADLTWALILAACRRVVEADGYVRAGEWAKSPQPFLGQQVHGATLGVLGFGRIGQAVARRAAGFDMTVLYHQPRRAAPEVESACKASFVGRDELLQRADILTLHMPYGPDTHHAIGAREIGLMKPMAVLVNAARGGIVDDAALIEALGRGAIAAAGLDVFENEPRLDAGYASLRNVVLTPHIGSATMATRVKMVQLAIGNLVAALTGGVVPAPVNPEVLPQRTPG
jgi:lactate dehydrogenase-like 2-hydroxyacid dehydrogenase